MGGFVDVDDCSGSVEIVVAEVSSPQLQGTFECTYSGTLAVLGALPGTLEGSVSPGGNATG